MKTVDVAISLANTLVNMYHAAGVARPEKAEDNIDKWVAKFGLRRLGRGNFSAVYGSDDSEYVIKLSFHEDAALTYMAWCRANPGKHIPNVHYLKRCGKCYVAVLDKLVPMTEQVGALFAVGSRRDKMYGEDFYEARAVLERGATPRTSVGEAALAIREFFKGVASHDLHSENAMRTRDGTLIITDPLSFIQSRDIKEGIERAYGIKEAA